MVRMLVLSMPPSSILAPTVVICYTTALCRRLLMRVSSLDEMIENTYVYIYFAMIVYANLFLKKNARNKSVTGKGK